MDAPSLMGLPSLRRQHLLTEFAGLRQACPAGMYVSLTPGNPMLWSGVLFVRHGPYAPAVLRFQISFPSRYPALPPLITFATDIFHPLIAPLTNYTYTTDIQDGGTVSATDSERLPSGGFSLQHGFPAWFGRARRRVSAAGMRTPPRQTASQDSTPGSGSGLELGSGSGSGSAAVTPTPATPSYMQTHPPPEVATYDVLAYISSAFDDAAVLDAIPLEAAGNPGAWHAWRSHRREEKARRKAEGEGEGEGETEEGEEGQDTEAAPTTPTLPATPADAAPEWNWEHVWEDRVEKGIQNSLSDPVLYGTSASDDVIQFLPMDEANVEAVKDNLKRTLGVPV